MSLLAKDEREILLNYIQDSVGCMRVALSKRGTSDHQLGKLEYAKEACDLKLLVEALRYNIYRSFDPSI